MYVDDRNELVCETRAGVVRPIVASGCGLVVREIVSSSTTMTIAIAERLAA